MYRKGGLGGLSAEGNGELQTTQNAAKGTQKSAQLETACNHLGRLRNRL